MRWIAIVFVLGLSGCTVIQDLDQFEEDFSCGVDIRLRSYTPHAQTLDDPNNRSLQSLDRERFGVYVVQESLQETGEFQRVYVARAFFDPLPSTDVDVRLPFAIEASQTSDELPATLEVHADRQTLRSDPDVDFFAISPINDDHSWIFPHACTAEGTEFPHNSNFDQLEPALEQAFGLKVQPADDSDAQFWVDTTIEVRVVHETIADGEEVDQARAFYRRGAATDRTATTALDAEIDLGGVIRDDENAEVIIFADRNGNGVFEADGPDFAVSQDIILGELALPLCDEGRPMAGDVVCQDEDDIVVAVSLMNDTNSTLITDSWWNIVEL